MVVYRVITTYPLILPLIIFMQNSGYNIRTVCLKVVDLLYNQTNNMKNLLEKLRPEIRDLLEKDLIEYPSSTAILLDELETTFYINDLKYFAILDIENLYSKAFGSRPTDAWTCLVDNYNTI